MFPAIAVCIGVELGEVQIPRNKRSHGMIHAPFSGAVAAADVMRRSATSANDEKIVPTKPAFDLSEHSPRYHAFSLQSRTETL